MPEFRPVVLCILDGWGISDTPEGNAPLLAKTPNFDALMARCPNETLITYGPDVGLPVGQMGNSEVGHMNIGAGRVVEMDLRRIDGAIERGEYAKLPGIVRFIEKLRATGGTAHLCGVLSDGGVHSHIDHMIATAQVLSDAGIPTVIHVFGDGRDVAPSSALGYLDRLGNTIPSGVTLATITGRYFALDRDNRWDRVQMAYRAMVQGDGAAAPNARAAIQSAYDEGVTDEFLPATVIDGYAGMSDGDGVLCLNFRADRAREIMAAIANPSFDDFDIDMRPNLAIATGMAEYSVDHSTYMDCIFVDQVLENTLGEWIAKQGKTQFRIAETEKYPHVTFFFNGGIEVPNAHEDRYLAPSPKVATYDLQPEMSEPEVVEHLVAAINSEKYDLVVVNFANPDMVGHTGDLAAAMAACEAVDDGLGQVVSALETKGGAMIVCADHGNCETMIDPETGGPHTAHTTNPVPVILVGGEAGVELRSGGRLGDLAPTLLALMGLAQPSEMTGRSLLT
jgi:2,3-bisphosphoglycerate-independent phosphoglycerate mutase